MGTDAERWDARYTNSIAPDELRPPEIVTTFLDDLPKGAATLDVASGWGDSGLFLAERGAAATLTDVSVVAMAGVAARAATLGLDATTVTTLTADLATEPVPVGPWDAITCIHYLDRELLPRLGHTLAPGGRLVCAIATTTNLERHERPSARFLLQPGELATLVPDLKIVHASEEWRTNGVHEAWLVAEPRDY